MCARASAWVSRTRIQNMCLLPCLVMASQAHSLRPADLISLWCRLLSLSLSLSISPFFFFFSLSLSLTLSPASVSTLLCSRSHVWSSLVYPALVETPLPLSLDCGWPLGSKNLTCRESQPAIRRQVAPNSHRHSNRKSPNIPISLISFVVFSVRYPSFSTNTKGSGGGFEAKQLELWQLTITQIVI